jgi:phage tail-like protein
MRTATNNPTAIATKRLLDYLPAIYHELDELERPSFLALYLRAFERILFGGEELKTEDAAEDPSDTIPSGLEEEIAAIPSMFDPWQTPEEFLPWLANWAALSLHPDLSTERRRKLLANIIPLYRIRGTTRYIQELLALCVATFVTISDGDIPEIQLQTHSTIGVDTYIGGGPPHFFSVRLIAPKLNDREKELQAAIAHDILAFAKPAHTFYDLTVISPRMQVGVRSSVGMNTVLGPV